MTLISQNIFRYLIIEQLREMSKKRGSHGIGYVFKDKENWEQKLANNGSETGDGRRPRTTKSFGIAGEIPNKHA